MTEASLFSNSRSRPLAEQLRPSRLQDIAGQEHLLGNEGSLSRMLAACKQGHALPSLILWGPPGSGKTTIARLLAAEAGLVFAPVSAVFDGVAELRRICAEAEQRLLAGEGTLLFVDEIHRFNKAQQDGMLPQVEDGRVILVGATTENPSFALNAALLSRCRVLVLNRLDGDALDSIISRAEAETGFSLALTNEAREALKAMADGDGRYLLNMVETLASQHKPDDEPLDAGGLAMRLSQRAMAFDRAGDAHYNLISALHKSLRASDADAALYWLARMIIGGEDARYILRRLTRFAAEDIGLADPDALPRAIAAWQGFERLGSPEGELAIAALVLYLATAPKSNAAYTAFKTAMATARKTGSLMPPAHILNAPTSLMKDLGYGAGYQYDHDHADGFSGQNCFPETLPRQQFYNPVERGFEREVRRRLEWWARHRQGQEQPADGSAEGEDEV